MMIPSFCVYVHALTFVGAEGYYENVGKHYQKRTSSIGVTNRILAFSFGFYEILEESCLSAS